MYGTSGGDSCFESFPRLAAGELIYIIVILSVCELRRPGAFQLGSAGRVAGGVGDGTTPSLMKEMVILPLEAELHPLP